MLLRKVTREFENRRYAALQKNGLLPQAVFSLIIAVHRYLNGLLCTLTIADFQINKALI